MKDNQAEGLETTLRQTLCNNGKSSVRQTKQSKSEIIPKAREMEIKEGRKETRKGGL
jgi:hypothetical protein